MKRSKGFTLVELLVVIAIIALLISILVPTLARARELAKRVKCGANLKGFGSSLPLYAAESNDNPPILPDIEQSVALNYAGTLTMGATCTAVDLGLSVTTVGGQQNLCLLVLGKTLTWELFLCASTGHMAADRNGANRQYGLGERVNGAKKVYTDYGLHIPYRKTQDGTNACPWNANTDPGVAIMADVPPVDVEQLRLQFSPNHRSEGENILYQGLYVRWSDARTLISTNTYHYNTAGWGQNCIYTADEWEGTPDAPILKENGLAPKTPIQPEATKDSVIFTWK